MRYLTMLVVAALLFGASGCGFFFGKGKSSMKSKNDARMELLDEYKECLEEAADEVQAMDCDRFLKAAENI